MSRRRRTGHEEGHENHERWLLTYADMITLLMVLFIVLFAISQVDKKKFDALHDGLAKSFGAAKVVDGGSGLLHGSDKQTIDPTDSISTERLDAQAQAAPPAIDPLTTLQQQLAAALRAHGLSRAVQFDRQTRGLVINVVTDKVLFDVGSADLRAEGVTVLRIIAPALRKVPNQLSIEGHTDNVPISGGRFASNWELSAERATTVLRFLLGQRVAPSRVSAAGYADQRPLLPNDTAAHRARNRRVAIVVLSSSPTGGPS